jgi:hypothetical protein
VSNYSSKRERTPDRSGMSNRGTPFPGTTLLWQGRDPERSAEMTAVVNCGRPDVGELLTASLELRVSAATMKQRVQALTSRGLRDGSQCLLAAIFRCGTFYDFVERLKIRQHTSPYVAYFVWCNLNWGIPDDVQP